MDEIKVTTKICKDACERWVDNLFTTSDWMKKKNPGITSAEMEKQFPILEDLDYVDFKNQPAKKAVKK